MRRVVSVFLPHWSTDRLRRKTSRPRPDRATSGDPPAPLVTAIPDHGRRIVAAVDADARALGVGVGLVAAAGVDRLAGGELTGGHGEIVLPAVAALMVAVGLLAALGPARRGLRIQPTEALRADA